MNNLTCIAKIEAKDGYQDQVKLELSKLIIPTRNEHGCVSYDVHTDNESEHIFMFHEIWESEAHLDAHLNSDHIKICFENIGEFLASLDVKRLSKVTV